MTVHEVCVQLRSGYEGLSREIDEALDNLAKNSQVARELIDLRTAGASDTEVIMIDEMLNRCAEIRQKNLEVLARITELREEYKRVLAQHESNEW